jgi:hypothetical protein
MFINVFDPTMKSVFFDLMILWDDEEHVWSATFDRLTAYEAYRVAVKNMMWFDRIMEYAGHALRYLCHDEKWDRFVRSDKLQKKSQSLLKVTPGMRQFHAWRTKKTLTFFE